MQSESDTMINGWLFQCQQSMRNTQFQNDVYRCDEEHEHQHEEDEECEKEEETLITNQIYQYVHSCLPVATFAQLICKITW